VWTEMEVCDDGNAVEEDACPSGVAGPCEAMATCGDGFWWAGVEGCDDGNMEDLDGCNNDCAAPRFVFRMRSVYRVVTGSPGQVTPAERDRRA
jgi:cysteine-rich repeat protein